MAAAALREPGCLAYERFLSADRVRGCVPERYASSDAAVAHLASFRERSGERYDELTRRHGFWVFGHLTGALRERLAPFRPEFLPVVLGFAGR